MATVLTTTYDSVTDTTALTITLASLASASTLFVGRESTAITNVTNLYIDAVVMGQVMTGTTPTVGTIEVWLYAIAKHVASTPTYPSPVTGTDAALTFVAETKARLYLIDSMATTTTSNQAYNFKPTSLVQLCGYMPIKWGVFVTHSTVAVLNATGGNHWVHYQGLKYTQT
jgi:hypothetical protein